jgi:cob(I)alamin adenosyltransferase
MKCCRLFCLVLIFLFAFLSDSVSQSQAHAPATTPLPNLADECVKQATDCMAKNSARIDSHEITTKAQADTANDACLAALKLCLDSTRDACLRYLKNDMANLCVDFIPKPPEPVVQDDCNVVPSSAQAGKAIQSFMNSGKALPNYILQMQQVQKNAFELEIKCEQLKAARTPCK